MLFRYLAPRLLDSRAMGVALKVSMSSLLLRVLSRVVTGFLCSVYDHLRGLVLLRVIFGSCFGLLRATPLLRFARYSGENGLMEFPEFAMLMLPTGFGLPHFGDGPPQFGAV